MRRLVLALSLVAGPALAQPVLEPVKLPFSERLTERVPVSGRTLVGLLSAPSNEPPPGIGFGPGSIGLPASLAAASSLVCVRATSQDGRYSAENTFTAPAAPSAGGRADLGWPTAYADQLRRFPLQEIAAVARRGACTAPTEIIPVIVGDGKGLGILQVLVNTRGSAVSATLRDPDTFRTLRRANCVRVAGSARVAFDARCVLGTTVDLPAQIQLRLEQVSRDGLQTEVLESLILRLAN